MATKKILNEYAVFSPNDISERADNIGTASIESTHVDYQDIYTADVADLVRLQTHKVSELHDASYWNRWSNFGVYQRTLTATGIEFEKKPIPEMGNFVGHSPTAEAPRVRSLEPIEVPSTEVSAEMDIELWMGEIDWLNGVTPQVSHITLNPKIDGTPLNQIHLDLSLVERQDPITAKLETTLFIDIHNLGLGPGSYEISVDCWFSYMESQTTFTQICPMPNGQSSIYMVILGPDIPVVASVETGHNIAIMYDEENSKCNTTTKEFTLVSLKIIDSTTGEVYNDMLTVESRINPALDWDHLINVSGPFDNTNWSYTVPYDNMTENDTLYLKFRETYP